MTERTLPHAEMVEAIRGAATNLTGPNPQAWSASWVKKLETAADRVEFLERDYPLVCERANREAQLASDLRTAQDQIIERCAKAVEDRWPDAARALRQHEDGISGEDFGEMRRENERFRALLARARSAYCDRVCALHDKWHADLCILIRRALGEPASAPHSPE